MTDSDSDLKTTDTPTDIEYVEVIKSDVEIDKAFIENDGQPAKILYYCRDCKKTVSPTRVNKKLSFKCSECEDRIVAFGTEKSVESYYKIK